MKAAEIPDHMLRLMDKSERKEMNLQTSEEAMKKFQARSEKELQVQISNLLRLRGIAFINPPMHRRSALPVGWPDFTFALRIPIAIEAKIGDNKPDEDQAKMHAQMRENGWNVHVVRSLQEAIDILANAH